jgi:hypothetical protein
MSAPRHGRASTACMLLPASTLGNWLNLYGKLLTGFVAYAASFRHESVLA